MSEKYWQCDRCGSIHIKEDDSPSKFFLDLGLPVVGGCTCTACGSHHEAADIYSGKLDPCQPDEEIAYLLEHPHDAMYDKATKRWLRRGEL